jgi:uncharacterized protein
MPTTDPNAALLRLAQFVDAFLPAGFGEQPNWASPCFRWVQVRGLGAQMGMLKAVQSVSTIALNDLHNVDDQKELIVTNTKQFVQRLPCNNVLLTGSRGTGKSSLIKACLHEYASQGLRLIEVDKDHLTDLPNIVDLIARRPERFIVYCDDLSFEDGEPGYKALKVALDGSIAAQSDNVVIYATSNRRHLIPEYMSENLAAQMQDDGEIHHGDTVEEKISLSERFGLWVNFYPFSQDEYLAVVAHWLVQLKCKTKAIDNSRLPALQFALERGSRSGRVAWQFAKDYTGKTGLK